VVVSVVRVSWLAQPSAPIAAASISVGIRIFNRFIVWLPGIAIDSCPKPGGKSGAFSDCVSRREVTRKSVAEDFV
jgi:hypothetical protein